MSLAVQVVFTGLSAGGVYGLIAIGHSPCGHAASLATLPPPFIPARAAPPLQTHVVVSEIRVPGRLSSSHAVTVSIDSTGQPFRVVDVGSLRGRNVSATAGLPR